MIGRGGFKVSAESNLTLNLRGVACYFVDYDCLAEIRNLVEIGQAFSTIWHIGNYLILVLFETSLEISSV